MKISPLVCLLAASLCAAGEGYHVSKKIHLPGDASWDYLSIDNSARRLYVTHGDRVQALDLRSNKLVGTIEGLKGVHGVALAAGKGFISDGKDNAVIVFDPKTFKILQRIDAGQNPDAIIYDPASQNIFVFNGKSQNAMTIDPSDGRVIGAVDLGGKPEFPAVDGKGRLFVNIEDKGEVVELDSKALKIMARWNLSPCQEPSSMAIDRSSSRLFIGCHNKMMAVVDANTGTVVSTPSICEHVDATSFDPGTNLIFSSCGDGTLTAIHHADDNSYVVTDTIQTQKGARTHALDPETHKIYLSVAGFGSVPDKPDQRPPLVPGTFSILVVDR